MKGLQAPIQSCSHRRTSQGAAAPSPLTRAKPLFFEQKLNFSGRSQQPKMKKKCIY